MSDQNGIYKPKPGTPINWSHPLAQGLVFCLLFNEGGGATVFNMANGQPGTLYGSRGWRDGGLYFDGSGFDCAVFTMPDAPFLGPISVIWRGNIEYTGTVHHFASKHLANGANNAPFDFLTAGYNLDFVRSNASGYRDYVSTISYPNDGSTFTCGMIAQGNDVLTTVSAFVNNTWEPSVASGASGSGPVTGSETALRVGVRDDSFPKLKGTAQFLFIYSRSITQVESQQLVASPYQMFVAPTVHIPVSGQQQGATKTYYPSTTDIVSGVLDTLTETDPSAENATTGWYVGQNSANYSAYYPNTLRARTTFGTEPTAFTGYGFRSDLLNGSMASATWSMNLAVKSGASYYTQQGFLKIRLWKSANADGTGATQLTSGWTTHATAISFTAANQLASVTISPAIGATTFSNEYLFLELEWYATVAATNNNAIVYLDFNIASSARFVTGLFTAISTADADNITLPITMEVPTLVGSIFPDNVTVPVSMSGAELATFLYSDNVTIPVTMDSAEFGNQIAAANINIPVTMSVASLTGPVIADNMTLPVTMGVPTFVGTLSADNMTVPRSMTPALFTQSGAAVFLRTSAGFKKITIVSPATNAHPVRIKKLDGTIVGIVTGTLNNTVHGGGAVRVKGASVSYSFTTEV